MRGHWEPRASKHWQTVSDALRIHGATVGPDRSRQRIEDDRAASVVYRTARANVRRRRGNRNGPAVYVMRNGAWLMPESFAPERQRIGRRPRNRKETESEFAPRSQTRAPARETVRLTQAERDAKAVRDAETAQRERARKIRLARAGLLGLWD